jgi:hypothetical protein
MKEKGEKLNMILLNMILLNMILLNMILLNMILLNMILLHLIGIFSFDINLGRATFGEILTLTARVNNT